MKWVVITSDHVSSSKTVFSAYIAALLDRNYIKVNYIKLNPALSVNVGMLSPEMVGEVFITHDGGQVDKDVGIIERSVSYSLPAKSCLTLGKAVYEVNLTELDSKDCGYEFLSMDQHLTDYIYKYISSFEPSIVNVIEVGGSISSIGTKLFCRAIYRMMKKMQTYTIHIGLNEARFDEVFGQHPSIFVDHATYQKELANREINKNLENQLNDLLTSYLNIKLVKFDLEKTYLYYAAYSPYKNALKIAIVGRYIANSEAYLSLMENIRHAAFYRYKNVDFQLIYALYLNDANVEINLQAADGVVIPGGFGDCGNEGMIAAIRYAREHDVPLIGICYGFEMMIIEFARNVCGIVDANTQETHPSISNPVICQLFDPSNVGAGTKYGHMSLGDYYIFVTPGTLAASAFQDGSKERNWNSYAMNMVYWKYLEQKGLLGCIWSEGNELVKGVELPTKRFFFGCQFHPEFSGNYNYAHKIFYHFIYAAEQLSRGQACLLKE